MGKRTLLLTVLIGVLASPAQAAVLNTTSAPVYPYQTWAEQSQVQLPHGRIRVVQGPCPVAPDSTLGCTGPGLSSVWVTVTVVDPADGASVSLGESAVRDILFHELGHVWDYRYSTRSFRARVGRFMGGWTKERFADDYSLCAQGITTDEGELHPLLDDSLATTPSLAAVCASIHRPHGVFTT